MSSRPATHVVIPIVAFTTACLNGDPAGLLMGHAIAVSAEDTELVDDDTDPMWGRHAKVFLETR